MYRLDSCLENHSGQDNKKPGIKLEKLFWKDDSPEKFTSILSSYGQEINDILNFPDTDAKGIVDKFQNLVKNVIEEGNLIEEE